MESGIYKIINKITGDFYIGSTSVSFNKRKKQHWSLLRLGIHHSIHLQRVWNKYGKENFEFIVIEKCDPNKCIEREQYYLDVLKSKYNISKVAGKTIGYKFTEDQKNYLRKIRKNQNLKSKTCAKEIYQFDKRFNFIQKFCSGKEAENVTGISRKLISCCCRGIIKTAKNYIFSFKRKINKIKYKLNRRLIIQFNLKGKLINEFKSIAEAAHILNLSKTQICCCCLNRRFSYKNFIFKYAE